MTTDTIIAAFTDFLSAQTEKIEKKDMLKIVNTVYADLKKKAKEVKSDDEKPKRKPTAYNIFMKEQMAILKDSEEGKEKDDCMTAKAKMQHIAQLWADKKKESSSSEEKENEDSSTDEEKEVKKVKKSVKKDSKKKPDVDK